MALLAACSSTPQHTNTLIFGTTTRVALDVSQEATGAMGVTLGYKRQEAVWMPLLANQAASAAGDMMPADCAPGSGKDMATHCPKFVGTAGATSTNGGGAQDTYSVLATFSGDMGGGTTAAASAPQANASAKVAQFFATGLAARLLAEKGGAGLVVAGAQPAAQSESEAQVKAAALGVVSTQQQRAAAIATKVSKTDDSVNSAALDKLLSTNPAKGLDANVKKSLTEAKSRTDLQKLLSDGPSNIVSSLWQALDAL
ncbi:MAG: hypothetical protein C4K60_20980 [Ideonella sp. MAG2]|nr:MAG: hypothetical protein C4K60_20980 [Ideonella sp. MAG2]